LYIGIIRKQDGTSEKPLTRRRSVLLQFGFADRQFQVIFLRRKLLDFPAFFICANAGFGVDS
jgi:hypothetical protein